MSVLRPQAGVQAQAMLRALLQQYPDLSPSLTADAVGALATSGVVQVRLVEESATRGDCSVAGGYLYDTDPPTLLVGRSGTRRRAAFTALHEFGHHLQRSDAELAAALLKAGGQYEDLEEAACEIFASRILLPDELVTPVLERLGASAEAAVELYQSSNASRAAVAVALAERLGTTGVVFITDATGQVVFTIGHGMPPPARGTNQSAMPLVARGLAAASGTVSTDTSITYRTGSTSALLYGQAAWCGEYLVAVAVETRAAWLRFSPPRRDTSTFVARDYYCEICRVADTPGGWCRQCGGPRCAKGHCACSQAAERLCQRCFTYRHRAQFPDGGNVCRDCA